MRRLKTKGDDRTLIDRLIRHDRDGPLLHDHDYFNNKERVVEPVEHNKNDQSDQNTSPTVGTASDLSKEQDDSPEIGDLEQVQPQSNSSQPSDNLQTACDGPQHLQKVQELMKYYQEEGCLITEMSTTIEVKCCCLEKMFSSIKISSNDVEVNVEDGDIPKHLEDCNIHKLETDVKNFFQSEPKAPTA